MKCWLVINLKMQTKIRQVNRNEVLLSNSVDNVFNTMLMPLNLLQTIVFDQKYRIRYKFITSNVKSTYLSAFCMVITVTVLNCYLFYKRDWTSNLSTLFNVTNYIIEVIMEPVALFTNLAFTVYYSNTHVILFLKLQRLCKFTKYSRNDFIIINWIGCVLIFGWYISILITIYITYKDFNCNMIMLMVMNSSVFCLIRFLNLLKKNLVLWTDNIRQLQKTLRTKTENETEALNESSAELFNYFKDILEAFYIIKKTYEIMVRLNDYNFKPVT